MRQWDCGLQQYTITCSVCKEEIIEDEVMWFDNDICEGCYKKFMNDNKCKNCGAPLINSTCNYCGTVYNSETIPINKFIDIVINGDMNNFTFKRGEGLTQGITFNSDMQDSTFYTDRKINLFINGDMNNIRMKKVQYSLCENNGDMNNIY